MSINVTVYTSSVHLRACLFIYFFIYLLDPESYKMRIMQEIRLLMSVVDGTRPDWLRELGELGTQVEPSWELESNWIEFQWLIGVYKQAVLFGDTI